MRSRERRRSPSSARIVFSRLDSHRASARLGSPGFLQRKKIKGDASWGIGVFLCPAFMKPTWDRERMAVVSLSLFSCEPGIHALYHGLSFHGGSGDQAQLRLDFRRGGLPFSILRRHRRRWDDLKVFSWKNDLPFLLAQNLHQPGLYDPGPLLSSYIALNTRRYGLLDRIRETFSSCPGSRFDQFAGGWAFCSCHVLMRTCLPDFKAAIRHRYRAHESEWSVRRVAGGFWRKVGLRLFLR